MISTEIARQIASEWHGGQASKLYAFSSSGHIDPDMVSELEDDLRDIDRVQFDSHGEYRTEVRRLELLIEYVRGNIPCIVDHDSDGNTLWDCECAECAKLQADIDDNRWAGI